MRTIIVRVFEPAPGCRQAPLQGVVEDVRTGVSLPFHGGDDLLRAVALATRASGDPAVAAGGRPEPLGSARVGVPRIGAAQVPASGRPSKSTIE